MHRTLRRPATWASRRLFWLVLLVAPATRAQSGISVLTGTVVDSSTRAPVSDVVVTATSPTLQGEQVVVTDASGLYRVPQLPPGIYSLRFEKESYRPYSRSGIDVAADRTLRLNVELLPETAGVENIAVVGTPPTIDVGSSTVGTTVSQDFVRNLPVARPGGLSGANRSFDSLATLAPTANADAYGVSISGSQSPENSYLIDGLAVNDTAYGVNGSPLTIEFIDEVNVITGGYMPEYGRSLGGALSAVTKSGGNEFHGSVFGTYTPGALSGAPASVEGISGGAVSTRTSLFNIGDFGATLGGYILKDRLWFFVGFQYAASRNSLYRDFAQATLDGGGNQALDPTTGQPIYTPIPGGTQRWFQDERSINYIAKLTYLITTDHRVSVSINGTPTSGGGDSALPFRIPGLLQLRTPQTASTTIGAGTFNAFHIKTHNDSLNVVGELNSAFLEKRLLLDARVGWHHQRDEGLPGDGSEFNVDERTTLAGTPLYALHPNIPRNVAEVDQVPSAVSQACAGADGAQKCGVLAWFTGGPGFIERLQLDSYQARGVLTYIFSGLGHHVFKVGVDGVISYYEHKKGYTGRVSFAEVPEDTFPGPGSGTQPFAVFETRNFGHLTGPDQPVLDPFSDAKTKSTILGGFVQDSWSILDKVTLNVGLRYDQLALSGADGVTRISLKDQISPRVGLVWDPTQQGRSKIYANYGRYYEQIPLDIADRELTTASGLVVYHDYNCDPLGRGVQNCIDHSRLYSNTRPSRTWLITAADQVPVDPNLKSPTNEEIVVGAEYEVLANARLGVNYIHRNLVRTVEDMSNDEAATYFIGNPGEGIASSFPKAKRTYDAVTVSFTKTFSDLWLAQVSYTWTRLHGNYDGLYRPENNQLDPNLNSTFDLKSLLLNQEGPLFGDLTHTVKVYLAKEFPILPVLSLTLGASYNGNSGPPISYRGAQVLYGAGEAYILQRGQGGRLPWVNTVDARVGVNYRLGRDSVVTVAVEGFNIFNSQRPTSVNENYTYDQVGPIPNGTQGSIPGTVFGSTVLRNDDPTKGPVYDPSKTFEENVAAGAARVISPGNGSLPAPGYVNGSAKRVLLPDPAQAPFPAAVNPTWGRPASYQAVRTIRFSARVTF
ncbi:MAG TPA: TonB-dependent receptor [Myxococcaceae bacterium]|nr:TonB-dependent receptor [Myxococcaceae bacterium]